MSEARVKTRPIADLLFWLAGPAVWGAHFLVMYGAHALMCARVTAGATSLWPMVAATTTVIALFVLAGIIVVRVWSRAPSNGHTLFARGLTIALAAVSILGVMWVALPAAVMAPCG